ncbi:hypothetical protein AVEN_254354-1 [Araneus ventricosus]|nr:hypothetical protein AVEN_254354-1 [Araneus ventricosus]
MMLENVGTLCPTCCTPFDKGKHRKLIDTCGHELCYMCINSDHCPLCVYHAQAQSQHRLSQDNGIPRPRLKTNGHFTAYMQTRERVSPERPLPGASLPPKVKPPVPERTVSGYSPRISRASRNHRQMKWPNPLISDSQAALSDDLPRHSRDNVAPTTIPAIKRRDTNEDCAKTLASTENKLAEDANTSFIKEKSVKDRSPPRQGVKRVNGDLLPTKATQIKKQKKTTSLTIKEMFQRVSNNNNAK